MYSFGIVLCELFSRQELYKGLTVIQIRFLVRTQDLRPELRQNLPPALRTLVEQCWDYDPALRPTMRQILDKLTMLSQDKSFLDVETTSSSKNLASLSNNNSNNNSNDNSTDNGIDNATKRKVSTTIHIPQKICLAIT